VEEKSDIFDGKVFIAFAIISIRTYYQSISIGVLFGIESSLHSMLFPYTSELGELLSIGAS